jgi:hypothetical protein
MRSRTIALVLLAAFLALGSIGVGACATNAPKNPPPSNPTSGGGTAPPPPPNPAPVVTSAPPPPPTVAPVAPAAAPAAAAPAVVVVAPPPAEPALAPAPAPPPAAAVPPQPVVASTAPAPARPYQDILRLKQAGLSDDFLLNKIRTENVNYQMSTSDILELRNAGVSETVLAAMLRSGQPTSATAGTPVARRAEFSGVSRVGRGFMGIGTKTSNVGRLEVDGDKITFTGSDPDKNFSIYAKNVKEIFNTCVLRPGNNLCLEVGLVTFTGDEYKFREPGYKNGDNHVVTEITSYFRQAFPALFYSERTVNEM